MSGILQWRKVIDGVLLYSYGGDGHPEAGYEFPDIKKRYSVRRPGTKLSNAAHAS